MMMENSSSSGVSKHDQLITSTVMPFTMTPEIRILNTIQAIEHVEKSGIPGAIVECGVWRGGNMMAAALKLNELNVADREIFLYDTFDGMSEPTDKDIGPDGSLALDILQTNPKNVENHYWAYTPLEAVKNNFEKTGYPIHQVRFVKGKVEDTIPGVLPKQIAVLRLDTDWYESTRHELEHLFPLLSPGGVLILDDYGFWKGAKDAVDEYWAKLESPPELKCVDEVARYCIKLPGSKLKEERKDPSATKKRNEDLARLIEEQEYLRERLSPNFSDPLYLHLKDLRKAMSQVETAEEIKILDYGCGGSPYRSLFPNADYKRADYLETEGIDYLVREDSTIDEQNETFDLVLSTQVLEHVKNPAVYLQECQRLLKPGGYLVLTTHGTYEDHGCPYDFQRWTADGLSLICSNAKFDVLKIEKLTTGARAVLFMLELYRLRFPALPDDAFGNALKGILNFIHAEPDYFHRWCDEVLPAYESATGDDRDHAFYLALLAICQKRS